ncbi:hypothetical protein [Chitinophaga sp. S165]|uniref:hypothetical protein n=1 Tax=Chitinophaga sp. S165 TaxID=2135462 RepID=UPI000D71C257|nr:hypothetical protein [Chitinophaga sp. S165]PWV51741.1 hypothetical protein C7475_103351 [Chitinophaga sp. S165]
MKNVRWLSLVLFIFPVTIASAQYADDDVTIHSNRKAKDPFKANGKSGITDSSSTSTTISLPAFGPEEKDLGSINISGIQIINAVSDSSSLGYVQTGMFNRWKEAGPDKPYTEYLQSYVDRRYGPMYKKDAAQLIWVIQELRVSERTFNMSEKSFLHLKAISFTGSNGDAFRQVAVLDTILVKGGMDVTHKHGENIATALQILLDRSLTTVPNADNPVYTMAAIREKALQRYHVPALEAKEHADGIYLTFKEFINDQPSISNITYSLDNNAVHFYKTDGSGNKTLVDKFWGVRKNGILYKQHYDQLIPIEQKQNSIALTSYLSQARKRNNAIIASAAGGGLIGGAIAGAAAGSAVLPLVDNIPYIRKKAPMATRVDIETGEFAL